MKMYDVEWEYIKVGHSQHVASSLEEMKILAEEGDLIEDFGNPDEFDEHYDCDTGWKVKSIKRIT